MVSNTSTPVCKDPQWGSGPDDAVLICSPGAVGIHYISPTDQSDTSQSCVTVSLKMKNSAVQQSSDVVHQASTSCSVVVVR